MEKKTVSARLPITAIEKLEIIQEEVIKRRMMAAGFNLTTINKTQALEWIIDFAFETLLEDGSIYLEKPQCPNCKDNSKFNVDEVSFNQYVCRDCKTQFKSKS